MKRAARIVCSSLLAALACAPSACSETPRCGVLEGCDIRKEACQQEAMRYTVCLRGRGEDPETPVTVSVLAEDEFVERRVSDALAGYDDASAALDRALTLFGLRRPEYDAEAAVRRQAQLTFAVYDVARAEVTFVDDGRPFLPGHVATLVRECVHALQAAAGELDYRDLPARFDARLAKRALLEGEAKILADEAWLQGWELEFDTRRYGRALNNGRVRAEQRFYSSGRGDVLDDVVSRSFAFGASYVWSVRQSDGLPAVADVLSGPPVSTYALTELDPARGDQRFDDLGEQAVPVLPELERVATVHLGRLAYLALTNVLHYGVAYGMPSPDAFVADTLSVFRTSEDALLAALRLRFDDASVVDAWREQVEALRAELPDELPYTIGYDDTDVWLIAAEDELARAAVPEELTFEAAPEDDEAHVVGHASGQILE